MRPADRSAIWTQLAAGRFDRAETLLRTILTKDPGDGDAWFELANVLTKTEQLDEAIAIYRQLCSHVPGNGAGWANLGIALAAKGLHDDAERALQRAARLSPKQPAPLLNLALLRRRRSDLQGALASFEQALQVAPDDPEIHYNMAVTLELVRERDRAEAAYRRVLALAPTHARAAIRFAQLSTSRCDYATFVTLRPAIDREVAKAREERETAVSPFFALSLPLSRAERKAVALARSKALWSSLARARAALGAAPQVVDTRPIHVGYISSDFRDHPVIHVTAGLFAHHDRAAFRITAYATTRPDDAVVQDILAPAFHVVRDLSAMSAADAARMIRADDVDILVDLSGFTRGSRPEILALRPARVQVNWLGFPGTLSGDIYDYIIADKVVIPPDHAGDYLEKIIWSPRCYMPAAFRSPSAPDEKPTRSSEALPEFGVVFASFNKADKIDPESFRMWMQILRRTAGSVLWLRNDDETAIGNLRAQAESLGVDPGRLVFARRTDRARHWARLALADLHLDTRIYGAHSTACEFLFAGVPVLALRGDAFASRVGASLLSAVSLPELVQSEADYEDAAVALADDPARLAALRDRLRQAREDAPLFDVPGFVRDLEAVYRTVFARHRAGLKPVPLDLETASSMQESKAHR